MPGSKPLCLSSNSHHCLCFPSNGGGIAGSFQVLWVTNLVQHCKAIMAKSTKKTLIRLVSTEGSGTFYVARTKGKTNLMLRKYDKKLRRHVMFKEAKMK